MFITLKRIIKSGLKTFIRNGLLSTSSILVTTITLVIISSLYLSMVLLNTGTDQIEKKVDVNVFFQPEAEVEKVIEFQKTIYSLSSVDTDRSSYKTKEEFLEEYKANEKNKDTLEAFDLIDGNPLGAVLNIKAKDIASYESINNFIESKEMREKFNDIIHNINYKQNKDAINKLNILISYIYRIGAVVAGIMIVVSIIVTFNTMRLVIYSFREEISIMRLVGASKFFARGPFIVEGLVHGLISGILASVITFTAVFYSSPFLQVIFDANLYQYTLSNIIQILGAMVLGGLILGFVSSYLSVSKYLKI